MDISKTRKNGYIADNIEILLLGYKARNENDLIRFSMHENGIQTIKISKTEVETEHMKLMERFGRGEAARRSSMAAEATGKYGVSGRRERVMSHKRRRGEERSVEAVEEEDCIVLSQMTSSSGIGRRHRTVERRRKQDQTLMVIGGVRVPRKARSALTKGSHENGVFKDQILHEEKVEARKEMKPIESDNRGAKLSKMCSGSVEEDIENETAEVLFGLMKQSQSSKDGEGVKSSTSNLVDEDEDRYSYREDPKISTSEQESSRDFDPELKKAEAGDVESKQKPKEEEVSMPNQEPKSEGVSGSIELHKEEAKPFVEESLGKEAPRLVSKRREDKIEFDLMAPPRTPMDYSTSDNMAASVVETLQENKIKVINDPLSDSRSQDDGTKLQQQVKAIIPRLDWQSRLTLQSGGSPLSQLPKRCVTHHYIARNIYLHKRATKTCSLSPPAAGSGPIRDTKQDIVLGNGSLGSLACQRAEESKDKSSEAMDIEALKKKKLAAQLSLSQPASAGNIVHGSTFKFSVGKNHATVAATSNPSSPPKHKDLTNNASHLFSHSTLSTVDADIRGSPNVTFQERPHLNEYSFPMTTPSGTTLTFQGESSTQAVPLVNCHHYPKLHHQRPYLQAHHQVRSNHQKNTGMSADSSSSHRQLESQQLQKTQVVSTQSWQSQKKDATQSLQPCKLENDINGGQTASSSHAQHSVYGYGQNYAVPFQPVNFTMMPYSTLRSGSSGNHIEQSRQQDLKGVFGISFGSISGDNSTGTLLNFSSVPQKPATYHNLPTTQSAHQKHHQVSERKTESISSNPDHDGSKPFTGRSSSTVVQTLVFDKSPSNLNFTASDSHQQRLYQFELQQQQRLARSKTPNNTRIFPQALMQHNTSIQSPSDSRRSSTSQVPVTKSTVHSFLEQQGRASQGQTQISFRGNPTSVSQGQQTNPSFLTT